MYHIKSLQTWGLFLCPIKKMQKVAQMQKVAYTCPMNNEQTKTTDMNNNNNTMAFGRINLRAMLHEAMDAQATRNYGGPNNATMNGKYYATNRGLTALRLTLMKK